MTGEVVAAQEHDEEQGNRQARNDRHQWDHEPETTDFRHLCRVHPRHRAPEDSTQHQPRDPGDEEPRSPVRIHDTPLVILPAESAIRIHQARQRLVTMQL